MAFRWTDTLGDNVLVVSKKIIKRDEEDRIVGRSRGYNEQADRFTKQVIPSFASRYKIVNDSGILIWKVAGISKACQGESINHTKNWTIFTDLNNDSKTEVWIIYKAECLDDSNGGDMKIIMHEGSLRYTMSGDIVSAHPADRNFDTSFRNGPEAYRTYALKLWNQFLNK